MDDTRCGKWDELGTVAELKAVVASDPDFDWSALRDFDGNGYPCESELGTGYLPTTTVATQPPAPTTTADVVEETVADTVVEETTTTTQSVVETTTTMQTVETQPVEEVVVETTVESEQVPLDADTFASIKCGEWLNRGYSVAELQQMVIDAGTTYGWGFRDGNLDGYPCDKYIGENYFPTTTTTTVETATTESQFLVVDRGMYEVGVDIQPGRHRFYTEHTCYWARLSGFSGEFSEIIANENAINLFIVDIADTDVAFEIDCDAINMDGIYPDPIYTPESAELFSATYEVGNDIEPGRYTLNQGRCYWARLSGFSGDYSDIIANDNVDGKFIVEIKASDVGFNIDC